MPDATALTMQPDVLDRPAPALSATSDAVKPPEPPLSEEVNTAEKPAMVRTHERDEKTGRFKTVDKPAEPAQVGDTGDAGGKPAKAVEPTGGDKQPVEATGADKKPEDEPTAAQRAAFARLKAQSDAQAREIAELRAMIPKAEPAKPAPRPDINAFDTPEAYETALTDWAEAEGARKATAQAEENRVKSEREAQAKAIAATWSTRQAAFKADHADYDTVTGPDPETGLQPNIPMHIAIPIAQMENGPAVEYWLGQHRDEADRIAALPPVLGVVEIGKLAAKIAEPAAKPQPKPKPAPIVPVGERSAPDTKDPDKMTTEEYAAHMKSQGRLRYGTR